MSKFDPSLDLSTFSTYFCSSSLFSLILDMSSSSSAISFVYPVATLKKSSVALLKSEKLDPFDKIDFMSSGIFFCLIISLEIWRDAFFSGIWSPCSNVYFFFDPNVNTPSPVPEVLFAVSAEDVIYFPFYLSSFLEASAMARIYSSNEVLLLILF